MNRLALIHGQKIVEKMVRFLIKRTIESMDRLAIIQAQKTVETTASFLWLNWLQSRAKKLLK